MNQTNSATKQFRTEIVISYVLRVGVILCATIIALGVLLTWTNSKSFDHFSEHTLPALTSGQVISDISFPQSAAEFYAGLTTLNPSVIIAFGLFLLILLPVVRVALTVVLFFLERDYAYLSITLFVLCVLLSGLIFGKTL